MHRFTILCLTLLATALSASYGADLPSSHQSFEKVHKTDPAGAKSLIHIPLQPTRASPLRLNAPARRVRRSATDTTSTTTQICRKCIGNINDVSNLQSDSVSVPQRRGTSRLSISGFYSSSKSGSSHLANDFVGSSASAGSADASPNSLSTRQFGGVINRPIYASVGGFYQRPLASQHILNGVYYPGNTIVSGGLIPSNTLVSGGSFLGGGTLVQPGSVVLQQQPIFPGQQQLFQQQRVLVQQPTFERPIGFQEDTVANNAPLDIYDLLQQHAREGRQDLRPGRVSDLERILLREKQADLPFTASNNIVDNSQQQQQQQQAPIVQSNAVKTSTQQLPSAQTQGVSQMAQQQQPLRVQQQRPLQQDQLYIPQQQQFQAQQPQQFQQQQQVPTGFYNNQQIQQPQQMQNDFNGQQQFQPGPQIPMGSNGLQDGGMQQPIDGGGCGMGCGGGGLGAGGLGLGGGMGGLGVGGLGGGIGLGGGAIGSGLIGISSALGLQNIGIPLASSLSTIGPEISSLMTMFWF